MNARSLAGCSRRSFGKLGCALAALLLTGGLAAAAPEDDPFSEANKAAPAQAEAPVPKKSGTSEKLAEVISFNVEVAPSEARPGQVVKVTLKGTPKKGWHTYPATKRTPKQLALQLSKLTYAKNPSLQALWPITESEPEFKDYGGQVLLEHDKPFTWSQDVLIQPTAKPGVTNLELTIRLMVCKVTCIGPGDYPTLAIPIKVADGKAEPLSTALQERLKAQPPPVQVVTPPANPSGQTAKADAAGTGPAKSLEEAAGGLWGLLVSAFIGALLMLLTPCVFPMVPITVNFFLKQSEKEHHRALPTASVYAGTIIVMLTLVLVLFGAFVVELAISPVFNLLLGLAMVVFALSLFGMFEIQLPQSLARFTSSHEGQGGYAGAVFMALTFTITSFTCTGPFLGAMLGGVGALRPPFLHLVLAALVYSATFAAPFFLLALFPSLLKMVPRSGGWLNAIKVTMGFIELALAAKFFSNADITWSPGDPQLFSRDTVVCAWMALSFAAGLYLIGSFRLPHDDPAEHIGVVRLLFAASFFGLALYMAPFLWGKVPSGVVGRNLDVFLPRDFSPQAYAFGGGGGKTAAPAELKWHLDYIDAYQEAVKDSKPIFIDFTGVTCTNCYQNERTVFPRPEVRKELERYARFQAFTDSVPNAKLEAEGQAARNARWRDVIGDPTNPYYVLFLPDKKEPFDKDGNLKGRVLATEKGTIQDVGAFVKFLQTPFRGGDELTVAKK